MYETDQPELHICHIKQFPATPAKRESFSFRVNYAQPSDIEEVYFGAMATIVRTLVPNNVDYIPSETFTTFPNADYFQMTTNLRELTVDDFASAMNLTTLILSDNMLKAIKRNVFSRCDAERPDNSLHKLRQLSLDRNEIAEIEVNSFCGLNNLIRLDLSGNQLTTIAGQTFSGLLALKRLDLSINKIEMIQDMALDLPALEQLILAHNKLTRLSDVVFERLPKLEMVLLDDNNLVYIGHAFVLLTSIAEISLDRNDIQDIDLATFAQLPQLKQLILTQSGFTFAATNIGDGNQTWSSPLTKLNIGGNYLSNAVDLQKLRIFPNLTFLGLSWNTFGDLEIGGGQTMKTILPSLQLLDLYGNTINRDHWLDIERELKIQGVEVRR